MTDLTVSEARAEAVTVVLKLMLEKMKPDRRKELMDAAQEEAIDIGHPAVIDEMAWLFC